MPWAGSASIDPEDYRRYVESVIAYETAAAPPHGREVAYWGTRNRADRATQLSADCLVKPLAEGLAAAEGQRAAPPIAEARGFRSHCLLGAPATRANLLEILHRDDPAARPSFLFTASHGLSWPKGHADPDGPARGPALPGLAGRGVEARFLALLDGGRPRRRRPGPRPDRVPVRLLRRGDAGDRPLPGRSLEGRRPDRRGAVRRGPAPAAPDAPRRGCPRRHRPRRACLGLLDPSRRAWATVCLPFRNLLGRVLRGDPVGLATKDFSDRYAAASMRLLNLSGGTNPAAEAPRRRDGRTLGRAQRRAELCPPRRPGRPTAYRRDDLNRLASNSLPIPRSR